MLKISKLSDYALVILAKLGEQPGCRFSAKRLAELSGLSTATVSKLLKQMHDANLVCSNRGQQGGYALTRSLSAISVADVVQAIEGCLALTDCLQGENLCQLQAQCNLKHNWQSINHSIYQMLASISLADMQQPLGRQSDRVREKE